jgi:hypothetical protein
MPSLKTLLPPEEQWNRTVCYLNSFHERKIIRLLHEFYSRGPRDGRSFSADELAIVHRWENELAMGAHHSAALWVVRNPHRLLSIGDVLVVTCFNGMIERYGVTGVSSKGAKLNDYYIALRSRCEEVAKLPGDLIDTRLDDPAIGRFVADLRASSRCRVGASIPAPKQLSPPSDQDTQGVRFDGCYRSRCGPRHKRGEFFKRNWLRFFPDGRVISSPEGGTSAWHQKHFLTGPWHTSGRFTLEGDAIYFSILHNKEVVSRFEGKVDGAYLRLSRLCRHGWAPSRDNDVYKFCPWKE